MLGYDHVVVIVAVQEMLCRGKRFSIRLMEELKLSEIIVDGSC